MGSELDQAQQRIAEHLHGGLLVLAPVGSGKTFALTERIGRALESGQFGADRILTLTFTNRAAREVEQRLADRFPDQASRPWVSTFHGLCATILRREYRAAGLRADFTICDEADSLDLLCELSGMSREALQHFWHDLERTKADCLGRGLAWPPDFERIYTPLQDGAALAQRYQHELGLRCMLDFADLVLLTNALFARQPEVRQRWAGRFDLVQVDEVQDTHRSEYNVLWVLARRSGNLALFGDVDQTIYGWRGSAPEAIISRFEQDFAPVTRLGLQHNHRATRMLVGAADGFAATFDRRWTRVQPVDDAPAGEGIVLHHAHDQVAEARWIAERVKQLVDDEAAITYGQVGILTGVNYRGTLISEAFQAAEVPHVTVEEFELFRRQEVKDALAYLRLLINPDDTGAMQRVLERSARGIGRATLARLRTQGEPLGLRLVDLIRPQTFTHGDPFGAILEAYRAGSITVFDLETTGLDAGRAEIVEIAAVRLERGEVTGQFETLIRPNAPVGGSAAVHGLNDADLANGRPAREALAEFFRFQEDSLLVGHNAKFDLAMLLSATARQEIALPELDYYADTLELARRFLEVNDFSLAGLARQLELTNQPGHRAMQDVLATSELLGRLLPKLAEREAERRALVDREAAAFADLAGQIDQWRLLAEALRPPDLLERVLEESGLASSYAEDARRARALRELVDVFRLLDDWSLFQAEALYRVMTQAALTRSFDLLDHTNDRVAIMTIHQAKGLEFDAVFIAGLTEGELPRRRSLHEGRLEEERRLFYVALTRARRRLFLSTHANNGYGQTRPSQFLGQLDPSLLDVV